MTYTREEKKLADALERGEFQPVPDQESVISAIKQMAVNTAQKRKPVTVRLLENDIYRLKAEAVSRGIPYQTLVSSVIRQYLDGKFKQA